MTRRNRLVALILGLLAMVLYSRGAAKASVISLTSSACSDLVRAGGSTCPIATARSGDWWVGSSTCSDEGGTIVVRTPLRMVGYAQCSQLERAPGSCACGFVNDLGTGSRAPAVGARGSED